MHRRIHFLFLPPLLFISCSVIVIGLYIAERISCSVFCSLQVYEVPLSLWMWKTGTELSRGASGSYRQQSSWRAETELWLHPLQLLPCGHPHTDVFPQTPNAPHQHAQHAQRRAPESDLCYQEWYVFVFVLVFPFYTTYFCYYLKVFFSVKIL